MNLKTELLAAARALDQAAIPYALCGGLAVVLHGFPRLTRDLDFLVQESDLEPAKEALGKTGFTIPGGLIPFDIGKEHKSKSRGISRDMSPEAISRRLDILVELHEIAQALASAKRLGKAELTPAPRSQPDDAER